MAVRRAIQGHDDSDPHIQGLLFSADDKALYWTQPAHTDPAHGMQRDFQLYRYDLASRTLAALAQFPPSFYPSDSCLL